MTIGCVLLIVQAKEYNHPGDDKVDGGVLAAWSVFTVDNHTSKEGCSEDTPINDVSAAPVSKCRKCNRSIDVSAVFCPCCGARQKTGDAWYYHPAWIAVLAFVLIGPLALPLVWKSTRMGPGLKVFMTALILVWTGYLGFRFYQILNFEVRTLNELDKVMRHIR